MTFTVEVGSSAARRRRASLYKEGKRLLIIEHVARPSLVDVFRLSLVREHTSGLNAFLCRQVAGPPKKKKTI